MAFVRRQGETAPNRHKSLSEHWFSRNDQQLTGRDFVANAADKKDGEGKHEDR